MQINKSRWKKMEEDMKTDGQVERYTESKELDIGRSMYHFLQYVYIPTRYTM